MNKPLYAQKVTLYHADPAARTLTRTVLDGVSVQCGSRIVPDAAGGRGEQAVLVVIPETTARYGVDYQLTSGDRMCLGEGAALDWESWLCWTPAEGDVLVLTYVLPFRLEGKIHHVEAGGWWTGTGSGAHSLTN